MVRKPSAIINEPKPDWVSLWQAPFYCFSGDYVPTTPEWADALHTKVREITQSDEFKDGLRKAIREQLSSPDTLELLGYRSPPVEWSCATKRGRAWIIAMGIRTQIEPPTVVVMPEDADLGDPSLRWLILGSSEEILSDTRWNDEDYFLSRDETIAAQWHRCLLTELFSSWERSFHRALELGAAHIMARKHSVLAPFERITISQWQHFRLKPPTRRPEKSEWGNPQSLYLPSIALGPADESLYEIYIAPGVNRSKSDARNRSPEENCLEWLAELIHRYPDRPPKPRDALAQEALSKFPGLKQNGFLRCFALVQVRTQNQSWSKPGRPKSPQKSLQQK
jgi:hypothetical protein